MRPGAIQSKTDEAKSNNKIQNVQLKLKFNLKKNGRKKNPHDSSWGDGTRASEGRSSGRRQWTINRMGINQIKWKKRERENGDTKEKMGGHLSIACLLFAGLAAFFDVTWDSSWLWATRLRLLTVYVLSGCLVDGETRGRTRRKRNV